MKYFSGKTGRYFTPCYTGLEMLSKEEFDQVVDQCYFRWCYYESSETNGFYNINIFGELPIGLEDPFSSDLFKDDDSYRRLAAKFWNDVRKEDERNRAIQRMM